MKRLFIIVSLLFFSSQSATGQVSSQVHSCIYPNGATEKEKLELAQEFKTWAATKNARIADEVEIWTVPIVFHVLGSNLPSLSIFEAAVDELNDAFANRGDFNSSEGADTRIQFCLVSTAPDGGATSGVNHIPSVYKNTDKDLDHPDLIDHSIKWDLSRYLNVWLVDEISGEALAYYEGKEWWTRLGVGGYSTGDGVVVESLNIGTLAHEIGHYFGLLHTWEGRDCKNDDCLVDGDMVCDTPPDKSAAAPCGDNSCDTDVLSNFSNMNFFTDVADMSTNFMDYSTCKIDFTWGQAERMRFTLETKLTTLFARGLSHPLCEVPCPDDVAVQVYLDNEFPLPGENVFFSSQLSGSFTNPTYSWFVTPFSNEWTGTEKASSQVSSSSDLNYAFASDGLYRVTLQVQDGSNPDCMVSFSLNVNVSCGVDSRFFPDKRLIASKQPHPLFTDSVTFTNRSYGANAYEWGITHSNFNPDYQSLPVFHSEDQNLSYYFKEPGEYQISLVAKNGNCEDLSNTFYLNVDDPTMDGRPEISQITCINEDFFQVAFTLYNDGYDTVNVNTPVAFYDADPVSSSGAQLLGVWGLPIEVYGFDQEDFTAMVEGDIRDVSEVFMVFNDTGTTDLPIRFPPGDLNQLSEFTVFPASGYSELSYDNNISSISLTIADHNPMVLTSELVNPSCSGYADGSFAIMVEGGSGNFNYSWAHDSTLTENMALELAAGNYSVEISDLSTCAYELVEFELLDPELLEILGEPLLMPTSCPNGNDGEVSLRLKGGSGEFKVEGYFTAWDGEMLLVSGISEGSFSLVIQDEKGCEVVYEGEMSSPDPLQVNFLSTSPSCPDDSDGLLTAEVSGGTPPYMYLWKDGSTGSLISELPAGDYELMVTDSNGCTLASTGAVEPATPQVRMPTGFNPQDGPLFPVFTCSISYKLMVWNRWGQLVYSGSEGWDGDFDGEKSLLGTYSYLLYFSYLEKGILKTGELRGGFILLR
ncbi:SprB repeat-containing protein [Algoriphagus locisalis]|uniref:SprB repeat-containing protein n=1 Tax=Algoriphagus locisalis TaxID=305507 RepID=A0A1I6Y825_9BACT|nr:M43 family zinc metalloprotease [Algoriphagus locisalis]SFT46612.1 SprB repeat-containing protein [Algoriphagus locisalis]